MLPRTVRRSAMTIAVGLGLALGAPGAAVAKECRDEAPLPAGTALVAPGADVPRSAADFAGAWIGAWKDGQGAGFLCSVLVVEEVLPSGHARVVYSHGTHPGVHAYQPKFYRATGRIVDGLLRFRLIAGDRPEFTYRLDGQELVGTYRGAGDVRLMRLESLTGLGCRQAPGVRPALPPGPGPRDHLTYADLYGPLPVSAGPVHNDYFLPVGPTAPALHAFRGTLTIAASRNPSAHGGCLGLPVPAPALVAEFFTHGDHLVPAVRDFLTPPGTVILSPGRVWSEPGDHGMSRASFPFAVTNPFNNAVHNGVATFLYDDTSVSSLRFQIVQETDAWDKADSWGQVSLTYAPGPIADEGARRAQYAEERDREAPVRPWSALPASAAGALAAFDGEAAPDDISASGLIVDGRVYLRGCPTRYGPFPYCPNMRHGVFSVTKTLGAAIALFRLAETYGDRVLDLKIADYVAVTATHDGWDRVTFADALNMATGIGDLAPDRQTLAATADENQPRMFEWLRARTAAAKLAVSFAYGRYAWGPGEVFRYNSTHTFVLAAAMQSFLEGKVGPSARLWDMVVDEVFRPIGIVHAPMMHTVETDGRRGLPIMAFGLYPTIDDIAKLTTLLQNGGRHEGRQILSAAGVAEALYRTAVVGLPTGARNRFGAAQYHLSLWSVPYRTASGCFFQIPYMAGYGGNFVVLMPNGVSAFRLADGFNGDPEPMILAGEALRPFCPSPAPAAVAAPPSPGPALTESELRSELTGRTFRSGRQEITFEADGRMYGALGGDLDVGTWDIASDGRYCRSWNVWDGGRRRCFTVHRADDRLELFLEGRWTTVLIERVREGAATRP